MSTTQCLSFCPHEGEGGIPECIAKSLYLPPLRDELEEVLLRDHLKDPPAEGPVKESPYC